MKNSILIAVCLLAAGCATRSPSARELQSVHGPSAEIKLREQRVCADLNADGHPETIVLFQDQRRSDRFLASEETLRDGLIVDGLIVHSGRARGVVVFYVYLDGGFALQLRKIDGDLLLVSQGGRDHRQHAWGWWSAKTDWPSAQWAYRFRKWNEPESTYEHWRTGPKVLVSEGK